MLAGFSAIASLSPTPVFVAAAMRPADGGRCCYFLGSPRGAGRTRGAHFRASRMTAVVRIVLQIQIIVHRRPPVVWCHGKLPGRFSALSCKRCTERWEDGVQTPENTRPSAWRAALKCGLYAEKIGGFARRKKSERYQGKCWHIDQRRGRRAPRPHQNGEPIHHLGEISQRGDQRPRPRSPRAFSGAP